jgi:Cdc6-like AAA superfamily ATPase
LTFRHFKPTNVEPNLLVDRAPEQGELRAMISPYLGLDDAKSRGCWAVIGEKGIGKSIFTRAVLQDLRSKHSGSTLFLEADCRSKHSWKKVIEALAASLAQELRNMQAAQVKYPPELLARAQQLVTLSSYDEAERREVHETLRIFEVGAGGGAALQATKALFANFGINLKRTDRELKDLTGKIKVTEFYLQDTLRALFEDIRQHGFKVIIYLDNVDELEHNYSTPEAIQRVRRDVEGLLELADAPVGLVLNTRTYFSSILQRVARDIVLLERLKQEDTMAMMDNHLRR